MSAHPSHQTVRLARGSHSSPAAGACVMELASMLAGEPFSDRPRCVCPVVASYLRGLNDTFDDRARQLLYPYAAAAVGTAADAGTRRRRVERCREAMRRTRSERGAVRRLAQAVAPPAPLAGSPHMLEHFTLCLIRAFRRSGPGWEHRALAFADELITTSTSGSAASGPAPRPLGENAPPAPVTPA